MKNKRVFTLDEFMLLIVLAIWCLLFIYSDTRRLISGIGLTLLGLTGGLLCSCIARIRLRRRHYEIYVQLNGASAVAPLNRPENRQMIGYMWRLRFRESKDAILSGLLSGAIGFTIIGYLGIALTFAQSIMRKN